MNLQDLVFQPEIQNALQEKRAVVALESTIISHGMPYPQNIETALEVEETVRREGAIPATLAVIDGKIKVGLTPSELERLGKNSSTREILKLSRRDLAPALVQKKCGATTVAATMICSKMAGIPVFATGGIGGVHREAEKTFDISADLQELSRTQIAVVSAGAKSILDIALTLEVLETLGVPLLGFDTKTFPAFYCRESEFSLEHYFHSPSALAQVITKHWELPSTGGVLIVNPVPKENALSPSFVEEQIQWGLDEAKRKGIRGKQLTPFLLSTLVEKTGGKSLETNIALIKNNAKLAAQVSVSLSDHSKSSAPLKK